MSKGTCSANRNADRIGLNFIRPDINRPGNYDFVNSGEWLVSQYAELGARWNRLAFSWVLIQPDKDTFVWEPYDRVVAACEKAGIRILATLGGHFDNPPVPKWAGESLKDVVNNNSAYIERFISAWVDRYKHYICHWEVLNEPGNFHKDLNVFEYTDRLLRPSWRIIKDVDPNAKVLPCAYNHLPKGGEPDYFWDAAHECCDIHNYHQYQNWGYYMTTTSAADDEAELRRYRAQMEKFGEGDKPFWVTETGWWGTGGVCGSAFDIYKRFPAKLDLLTQPACSGKNMLSHPIVIMEDAKRAEWMKDLFPRIFGIPGCEKAFLWVSLDEFEGGFDADTMYGKADGGPAKQVDLWGIIAGDRTWRTSAHAFQELLRQPLG